MFADHDCVFQGEPVVRHNCDLSIDRDRTGIGKRKSIPAASRAEHRADTGLSFEYVQLEFCGTYDAGAVPHILHNKDHSFFYIHSARISSFWP
jgi:hypothetical protein